MDSGWSKETLRSWSGIIPFRENKFGCNPGRVFEIYLSLLNPDNEMIMQLPRKPTRKFQGMLKCSLSHKPNMIGLIFKEIYFTIMNIPETLPKKLGMKTSFTDLKPGARMNLGGLKRSFAPAWTSTHTPSVQLGRLESATLNSSTTIPIGKALL